MRISHKKKGFTLIELILYIAIASMIMVGITTFSINIIFTSEKSEIRQEVQQNAIFAMQKMMQEIRESNDLNIGTSTFGSSPGVLSLSRNNGAEDPTVLNVSNGSLQISRGATGPFDLISNNIEVTNLIFTNLSFGGRTTIIKIELTLNHKNAAVSNIADAEVSLRGAALIREKSH